MSSEVKPWRDVLIANYCTNVPGAVVLIIVLIKLYIKNDTLLLFIYKKKYIYYLRTMNNRHCGQLNVNLVH